VSKHDECRTRREGEVTVGWIDRCQWGAWGKSCERCFPKLLHTSYERHNVSDSRCAPPWRMTRIPYLHEYRHFSFAEFWERQMLFAASEFVPTGSRAIAGKSNVRRPLHQARWSFGLFVRARFAGRWTVLSMSDIFSMRPALHSVSRPAHTHTLQVLV
jgi:hypothetical protein